MKNLKFLRKSANMTLQQLAEVLGTSNQVLSRYERCEREADYDMLVKIARFFNVSIDYLLGFKSATTPTSISLPLDKKELIDIYDSLDEMHRVQVLEYARYFAERTQNTKRKNF